MQVALFATALIVASVYGAPPSTPGAKEIVEGVAKKCVAQTKASPEQAKLAFSQAIPKNDVERCFMECVYTGVGLIKDGKFNVQGGQKLVALRFQDPKEKVLAGKLIESCSKEITAKADEKCSLGRAVRECFVNHGKQVNFFPSA